MDNPLLTKSTPGARFMTKLNLSHLTKKRPEKSLSKVNPKSSGRNTGGKITVRHQGGRQKRLLREIDWKRDKNGVVGTVATIEFDPNRTANIALINYVDGDKRYIIAPEGLHVGQKIMAGEMASFDIGNSLPLGKIPVGTTVHSVELRPGKGGQLARSAGSGLLIQGREPGAILIKLPSGEIRRINPTCYATIGQVSNPAWKTVTLGKAGRKRRLGIRPTVRGVAQHPDSHPHGGGEGRSGIGMPSPKTPWGKRVTKKTRNPRKYSNRSIVQSRKSKS